ncbi:hypothetical protein [Bradyrhizobium sp. 153]|uniref:hypothetical protein n=1 Tax=Bradyrhizobium sp. 153 TaxID=2782627 RepID=UPI001FFC02FB|nr:hypothetical protein [Bradyrhizobium sp. 153]MCK1669401.1 hypothetical protein [Bradyrhizobium sp. 153]
MILKLRPTVIGGETAEGDFVVVHEGREVGRIRKTEDHVHGTEAHAWTITVPLPLAAWSHGSSANLEAAKEAFRTAWEQFYSSLTPEQIARWHHTQDARKPPTT